MESLPNSGPTKERNHIDQLKFRKYRKWYKHDRRVWNQWFPTNWVFKTKLFKDLPSSGKCDTWKLEAGALYYRNNQHNR